MLDLIKSRLYVNGTDGIGAELTNQELVFKSISLNKRGGLDVDLFMTLFDHDDEVEHVVQVPISSTLLVHADVSLLFKKLAGHYALVLEYATAKTIGINALMEDGELPLNYMSGLHSFKVKKVIFNGEVDSTKETVKLSGVKVLASGLPNNMLTPAIQLEEGSGTYTHSSSLKDLCDDLRTECLKYLSGKRSASSQMVLEMD